MKKVTIFTLTALLIAVSAYADNLRFTWNAYTGTATEFRIKQDTDNTVFHVVTDVTLTEAIVPAPTDLDCHNYWIVAVNNGIESLRGAVIPECPGEDPPITINRPIIINGFGVERIIIE